MRGFLLYISLLLLTGPGCAFLKNRVELKSEPAGAEVQTPSGEKLGVTPLVLEGDLLQKASQERRLSVVLRSPGYAIRALTLDVHNGDTHSVKLEKLEPGYFSKQALSDFNPDINTLVRDMLRLQGLILVKKTEQAEKELEDFQNRYPNVAASYVMQADLALMQGKKNLAQAQLLRARSIDPGDPVIRRMLQSLGVQSSPGTPEPAQEKP